MRKKRNSINRGSNMFNGGFDDDDDVVNPSGENGTLPQAEMSVLIRKIQSINQIMGHKVDLKLPRIAVIGDQSSGKSSTLETLIRRDFLPRGNGCVTRCPLVITLVHTEDKKEVVTFTDTDGGEEANFKNPNWDMIRKEVDKRMVLRAGSNCNIVDEPIAIRLMSRHVPDLELIDLPGFTRNPKPGQPFDIERRTIELSMNYIQEEKTIILAVTAANVDIHTSEAIRMAKMVDPQMVRTIGVLTKPDTVEKGPDLNELADVLSNKVLQLKKGYFIIKNRSMIEIETGMTAEDALKKENNYFDSVPEFLPMRHRAGSALLLKELCKELALRIKESLPALNQEIDDKLEKIARELKKMGHDDLPDGEEKSDFQILMSLVSNFSSLAKQGMYGLDGEDDVVDLDEMKAGAEIGAEINRRVAKLNENISEDLYSMRDAMAKTLRGMTGIRDAALAPPQVIELQVAKLVKKRRKQCEEVVHHINQMLIDFVREVAEKTMGAYPKVKKRALDLVEEVIEQNQAKTNLAINLYLDAEKGGVNTNHPNFEMIQKNDPMLEELKEQEIAAKEAMKQAIYEQAQQPYPPQGQQQQENGEAVDEVEDDQIRYFMVVVMSYMEKVVEVNLKDIIPKMIRQHLISATIRDNLESNKYLHQKMLNVDGKNIAELVQKNPKVELLLDSSKKYKAVKKVLMDTKDMDRTLLY